MLTKEKKSLKSDLLPLSSSQVAAIAIPEESKKSYHLLNRVREAHINQYETYVNIRTSVRTGTAVVVPTFEFPCQHIAFLFCDQEISSQLSAIASLLGEVERLSLTSVDFMSDENVDFEAIANQYKKQTRNCTPSSSLACFQKLGFCEFCYSRHFL